MKKEKDMKKLKKRKSRSKNFNKEQAKKFQQKMGKK